MLQTAAPSNVSQIGTGFYTVPEAARLLKIRPLNIRRWLGGYRYAKGDETVPMPPLWTPELPAHGHHIELGFRDLIELRFIKGFIEAGVSLKTIRHCLDVARDVAGDDRPFSTQQFRTDGRKIYLEGLRRTGEEELFDLKERQYVIKKMIDRTFRDLDISDDIVTRWRPFDGRQSIVIDPQRAFGQPIASAYGVPTVVLAQAAEAEGSVEQVARLYDVSASAVRGAVRFEHFLAA
jgi:uncharacterized protein (DUF433 family)